MTSSANQAYEKICFYTLSLQDENFIHQHVVDAFAAQDASDSDKPIRLFFALVGLYLHVENGFNGRQVQQAHMELARAKLHWPRLELPANRGTITAVDVENAPTGHQREELIHLWCESIWEKFIHTRPTIQEFLKRTNVIG